MSNGNRAYSPSQERFDSLAATHNIEMATVCDAVQLLDMNRGASFPKDRVRTAACLLDQECGRQMRLRIDTEIACPKKSRTSIFANIPTGQPPSETSMMAHR